VDQEAQSVEQAAVSCANGTSATCNELVSLTTNLVDVAVATATQCAAGTSPTCNALLDPVAQLVDGVVTCVIGPVGPAAGANVPPIVVQTGGGGGGVDPTGTCDQAKTIATDSADMVLNAATQDADAAIALAVQAADAALAMAESCLAGTDTTCNTATGLVQEVQGLATVVTSIAQSCADPAGPCAQLITSVLSATGLQDMVNSEVGYAAGTDPLDTGVLAAPPHSLSDPLVEAIVQSPTGGTSATSGTTSPLPAADTIATATELAAGPTAHCQPGTKPVCAPPMTNPRYNSVVHNPQVNVVLWGSKWNQSGAPPVGSALASMFGSMSGSSFQNVLNQYYDATDTVGTSVSFGGVWCDCSGSHNPGYVVTAQDLLNEAIHAKRYHFGSTSPNTVWMIIPQAGAHPVNGDSQCGFHSGGFDSAGQEYVWGVADYPAGFDPNVGYDYADCRYYAPGDSSTGDIASTISFVASHEYAEAVTNPLPYKEKTNSSWNDTSGHNEIGDLCAAASGAYGPGGQWVTQLWSNDGPATTSNLAGHCATSFTPTYSYSYVSQTNPVYPAHDNGKASLGHGYPVTLHVRNTGTMPWFPKAHVSVRLGTAACSNFYDWVTPRTWSSCSRIPLAWNTGEDASGQTINVPAGPGQPGTFKFDLRPSTAVATPGSYSEAFNLVADGSGWMPSAGISFPIRVGQLNDSYSAQLAAPNGSLSPLDPADNPIVTCVAGVECVQQVSATFTNTGDVSWYGGESMYLATAVPNGHVSAFADPTTWPNSHTAAQLAHAAVPGATGTFSFAMHVKAGTATGIYTEHFVPAVETPAGSVYLPDHGFSVTVVVLDPAATGSVYGRGTFSNIDSAAVDPCQPTTDGCPPPPQANEAVCAAAAAADALQSTVVCTATTADGLTHTATGTNPGAATGALIRTDVPIVKVCWTPSATYALAPPSTGVAGCTTTG
jgi:hypothetical protein